MRKRPARVVLISPHNERSVVTSVEMATAQPVRIVSPARSEPIARLGEIPLIAIPPHFSHQAGVKFNKSLVAILKEIHRGRRLTNDNVASTLLVYDRDHRQEWRRFIREAVTTARQMGLEIASTSPKSTMLIEKVWRTIHSVGDGPVLEPVPLLKLLDGAYSNSQQIVPSSQLLAKGEAVNTVLELGWIYARGLQALDHIVQATGTLATAAGVTGLPDAPVTKMAGTVSEQYDVLVGGETIRTRSDWLLRFKEIEFSLGVLRNAEPSGMRSRLAILNVELNSG
jgi:hypothetical protein